MQQVREDARVAQTIFLDKVKQRRLLLAKKIREGEARKKLCLICAAGSSNKLGWAEVLEEFRLEDERVASEAVAWDGWWRHYGRHGEAYLTEGTWLESDYRRKLQCGMNDVDLQDAIWQIKRKQRLAAECSACGGEDGPCGQHLWPAETPRIDEAVILALGQDPRFLEWSAENPSPWDSKLD